jgi:hypothetical protein
VNLLVFKVSESTLSLGFATLFRIGIENRKPVLGQSGNDAVSGSLHNLVSFFIRILVGDLLPRLRFRGVLRRSSPSAHNLSQDLTHASHKLLTLLVLLDAFTFTFLLYLRNVLYYMVASHLCKTASDCTFCNKVMNLGVWGV